MQPTSQQTIFNMSILFIKCWIFNHHNIHLPNYEICKI